MIWLRHPGSLHTNSRVLLGSGVARIWYDQWKKSRVEGAPIQIEEDKLKDMEEFHSKRAKTTGHESGHQKNGNMNRSYFQKRLSGSALSSASEPPPRKNQNSQNFKVQVSQSQGSVAQEFPCNPLCGKCGKLHQGKCCFGMDICYKCGRISKECPKNRHGNGGNKAQSS
uniref:Gag-pol protein n=1 Tax=Solanum tuberosum TaxID=4113 RepID=M1DPW6_SOLTU